MSCVFLKREKKSQRLERNEDFKSRCANARILHARAPARVFDALCRRALDAKRARFSKRYARFQSQ